MVSLCSTVNATAVQPIAGMVNLSEGRLNIRSSPSTSAAIVSKLNAGTNITLISKNSDWWFVEYAKDSYGYCHSSYISAYGGTQRAVYTHTGKLNVRSGPGVNNRLIDKLSSGEKLIVLSSDGYWSKILYHGTKIGYVYNTYLGPVKTTNSENKAVKLNVPSYKQYDSRWSGVKIGNRGETIGTIGCATTAIAMLESYRNNTVITPDAMRYKLSYTSSGSVYWPSDYKAVTQSSNYLSGIYEQLKMGKPVLLGMKNSYGGQHWVVVTGFKGGSISSVNFTINDPGSGSRTTLSQLTNSYPVFYKYFTY